MNISWDDAKIFLTVAEEGSFSAAALALRMGQPTVSRRISHFEDDLGYALFYRGRRGTELTKEGERLLPAVQQMARWANEMEAVVAGTEASAAGRVTIAAPPGVAYEFLVPFVAEMKKKLPDIRFELRAAVEFVDLTRGDADLAIRTKPSDDPALMTLTEVELEIGTFASPNYASAMEGSDLADIGWIAWSAPYLHLPPNPELEAAIPDFEPAFASDNYLLKLRACELGLGAMIMSRAEHRFNQSRLVELDVSLPDYKAALYLVCARSMRWVPRVRAVIDELADELRALA